jgi:hypothetical protein
MDSTMAVFQKTKESGFQVKYCVKAGVESTQLGISMIVVITISLHAKLIVDDYSSSTVFSLPMNVHILKAVKSPVAYRAGSIFTPLQIVSKVHKKYCKAPHTISGWIS